MNAKTDGLLNLELLQHYAIVDREADFEHALQNGSGKVLPGGLISVKSNRDMAPKHGKKNESQKSGKKRNKDDYGSKSNKRKAV